MEDINWHIDITIREDKFLYIYIYTNLYMLPKIFWAFGIIVFLNLGFWAFGLLGFSAISNT